MKCKSKAARYRLGKWKIIADRKMDCPPQHTPERRQQRNRPSPYQASQSCEARRALFNIINDGFRRDQLIDMKQWSDAHSQYGRMRKNGLTTSPQPCRRWLLYRLIRRSRVWHMRRRRNINSSIFVSIRKWNRHTTTRNITILAIRRHKMVMCY